VHGGGWGHTGDWGEPCGKAAGTAKTKNKKTKNNESLLTRGEDLAGVEKKKID
jgi:hypothetical protein